MSLPDAWVDRIFDKLTVVYGHQFLSRWDGMELADVKADWAHELRGFAQNLGALKYGLEHLPVSKPPSVLEFRAICNSPQAPRPEITLRLQNQSLNDEREQAWQRHYARLQQVRSDYPDCKPWHWALALELKDNDPLELPKFKPTQTVRAMYQGALEVMRVKGRGEDQRRAA